uniref:Uncharacterized protein n=1 Tax=Timema cristinae TaxID=61476 RepID=A0A7R9D1Q3_TIMCR|nr:unnamed protein product [Timema cristinae]
MYSSPMASLVLTDNSHLTSNSQHLDMCRLRAVATRGCSPIYVENRNHIWNPSPRPARHCQAKLDQPSTSILHTHRCGDTVKGGVREEEAKSLGAKTGLHTRTTPISTQPQHCRYHDGYIHRKCTRICGVGAWKTNLSTPCTKVRTMISPSSAV